MLSLEKKKKRKSGHLRDNCRPLCTETQKIGDESVVCYSSRRSAQQTGRCFPAHPRRSSRRPKRPRHPPLPSDRPCVSPGSDPREGRRGLVTQQAKAADQSSPLSTKQKNKQQQRSSVGWFPGRRAKKPSASRRYGRSRRHKNPTARVRRN